MSKTAKPLGDRVLVKVADKTEKTVGGIIIPETVTKDEPKIGIVHSVGTGLFTQNGVQIPMSVAVGDEVIIPAYHQGVDVKMNDEKYLLLRESEILMVIK